MEKLALRSLSSQAKIVGAIVSIAGALVVVLYQGPIVVRGSSSSSKSLYLALRSPQSNWIIGGALLTANCFVLSLWYIIQGLLGTSFATVSLTWGLRLKGPVCVALFTPLSIVITAFMGVIFLGDSL
ncbi:unnamed protein product [Ilex paraguariensis]|uniref:WAT1-related protein n=1 Tax=Ilex paraguariensis TaxID=185542 RepID=A0ABC8T2R9_9AQUA